MAVSELLCDNPVLLHDVSSLQCDDTTTRVAVVAVRLFHREHTCRTAPSPAPVFVVISQLGKIL